MSINHGHVCSKSFLTRSHLWLFNYKQKKIYQQKKTADWKWIFMCVFWVYSPAGWRHPHPPPDLTRNTLCMHLHVHRKPLAQQVRPGDTDLSPVPAPGALCRFSRPNTTNQIFFQQANMPSPSCTPSSTWTQEKRKKPSKLLDKLSHIYWMRFISTTKKF